MFKRGNSIAISIDIRDKYSLILDVNDLNIGFLFILDRDCVCLDEEYISRNTRQLTNI